MRLNTRTPLIYEPNSTIHSLLQNSTVAIKACGKSENSCGKPVENKVENLVIQKVLLQILMK
jgi:hypothetical protein